jgi:hypothetical protein
MKLSKLFQAGLSLLSTALKTKERKKGMAKAKKKTKVKKAVGKKTKSSAKKKPVKKIAKKKVGRVVKKKKVTATKKIASVVGLKKPAKIKGTLIGKVTHFFPHVNAAVVKLEAGELKVGHKLQFRGHTTDFKQVLHSMQINHAPINRAIPGDEIGIQVKSRVREGDEVYILAL